MTRAEVDTNQNIVIRLGDKGAILKSIPIDAFWLREHVEGFLSYFLNP